ncbi:MAG: hypothetical protein ABJA98_31195 [Acidobacteriota bacterium]
MSYRIFAIARDGQWVARAEREDTGKPFGIECTGATGSEAIVRLTQWLEWQGEHTAALAALQTAERVYQRNVAGAFARQPDASAIAVRKDSLDALEAARVKLDDVRSRKPERSS